MGSPCFPVSSAVRWPGHASRLAVLLASLAAPGCAPDRDPHEGVVETSHLRISNTTGNPICAGTPLLLEAELERIAATLELPLWSEDDKLEVRLGEDAVAEVCASWDPDDISGCVGREEGARVVAAVEVAYTVPHELVHAVRLVNDTWSTTAFEEGLAELLSGSDGFPRNVQYPQGDSVIGPIDLLEIPREDFHRGYYVASASFLSWLWETRGGSAVMAFLNDPGFDGVESALPLFEQHFGLPLAEAEQAWRVDDRPDPVWGAPCLPERTYSLADGPVELTGDFDCADSLVYGGSYWMSLPSMCLEVPETTRVRISVETEHGRFAVLNREPCDVGPASAEAFRDKYVEAGQVLEQDIIGCRHRLIFHSQEPGFPITPYRIRIEEL